VRGTYQSLLDCSLIIRVDSIAQLLLEHENALKPINMMLESQFAILQAEAFRVVVKLFRSRYGRSHISSKGTAPALVLALAAGDQTMREAVLQLLYEIVTQDRMLQATRHTQLLVTLPAHQWISHTACPCVASCAIAIAQAGSRHYLEPIAASRSTTMANLAKAILQAIPKSAASTKAPEAPVGK
jgi:hypothetical protein